MAAVSLVNKTPTRSLLAGNTGWLTAYEHIQSVTVGPLGASSVSFTEIPQGYRHLQIRYFAMTVTSGGNYADARINGDAGTNYSIHHLRGNGITVASGATVNADYIRVSPFDRSTNNVLYPYCAIIDIWDYANTAKYKTIRTLYGGDGNGDGEVNLSSGSWRNTASVTSFTLLAKSSGSASTFGQYSSFQLYGVK